MLEFIVRITYQNGAFTYLVLASDEKQALHLAEDFGVHGSSSVIVESVIDAFSCGHISSVSRIR